MVDKYNWQGIYYRKDRMGLGLRRELAEPHCALPAQFTELPEAIILAPRATDWAELLVKGSVDISPVVDSGEAAANPTSVSG